VIAQYHYVHALQAHDTKCLWPTAVVANANANLCVHRPPDFEALIADVEEFFLQMLEWRFGFVLCMAGQVHLAIAPDDASGRVHEDRGVEALARVSQFRIAEVKTYAEL